MQHSRLKGRKPKLVLVQTCSDLGRFQILHQSKDPNFDSAECRFDEIVDRTKRDMVVVGVSDQFVSANRGRLASAPIGIFRHLRGSWTKPTSCAITWGFHLEKGRILENLDEPVNRSFAMRFLGHRAMEHSRSAKLMRWEATIQTQTTPIYSD